MKPQFSGLSVHFLVTISERKVLPQKRNYDRHSGAIQGEPSVYKGERRGLQRHVFPSRIYRLLTRSLGT